MPIIDNMAGGNIGFPDAIKKHKLRQRDVNRMNELQNKQHSLNKEELAELDALRKKYDKNNYEFEKFMRGENISSQPSIWGQSSIAFNDIGKNLFKKDE